MSRLRPLGYNAEPTRQRRGIPLHEVRRNLQHPHRQDGVAAVGVKKLHMLLFVFQNFGSFRKNVFLCRIKLHSMVLTRQQEHILDGIKTALRQNLPENGVALLYGSQARGDFRNDSDWDILILLDKDKVTIDENSRITYPLVMFGWDAGVEINPVVYTKHEWDSYRDTPFHDNVDRDALKIAG